MRRERFGAIRVTTAGLALVGFLVLALTAGCGSGTGQSSGPAAADPGQMLAEGSGRALAAGSVRFTGSATFGAGPPVTFDGVLSWSDGTTGEITMNGGGPTGPMVARITGDAIYTSMPPGMLAPMSDKRWGKYSFADMTTAMGPVGELFRAALAETNPVRSAAMLLQAGDLQLVGEEQRNGVVTTHYAGTVDVTKLITDLRLGLTDEVLEALRQESLAARITSEKLDLWLDDRGFPIHAEVRTNDPTLGPVVWSADYRDYGGPQQVQAPPPNEVYDLGARMNAPPPLPSPPR
ncbi:MAG: hypothetical protein ACRDRK_19140 [Pseudonocardia sp.]